MSQPRRREGKERSDLMPKDLFQLIAEDNAAKEVAKKKSQSRGPTPAPSESGNEDGEEKKEETPQQSEVPEDTETTLLFVGPKSSGKTSLVMRFLNKQDRDKPPKTTALEYTYARREKNDMAKEVVNVWELAGGKDLANLMDHAITPATVTSSAVAIVVDLSQPSEVLDTVLFWTERIKQHANACLRGQSVAPRVDTLISPENEDMPILSGTVMPIPLVIIANKYDTFQDVDAEYRKAMSRALRYVAHINGATLIYTSCKVTTTKSDIVRAWLNHYCFGTTAPKAVSADHHKTILIPAGVDNVGKIGPPPAMRGEQPNPRDVKATIRQWKEAFVSEFFPPSQSQEKHEQMENIDNFAEPLVDAMRAQKDDELDRYRKTCEQKAREEMSLRDALKGGSIQVVSQ